jgi:hypothetical protein
MNWTNTFGQRVYTYLLAHIALLAIPLLAQAVPQYQMVVLSNFAPPGQYPSGEGLAINDAGLIVGELNSYYNRGWVGSRAARWPSPSTPQSLGDLFGRADQYSYSAALGVNAGGTAVGWSFGTLTGISGYPSVATWWGPEATTPMRLPDIVDVPDSSSNNAASINDGGAVVGSTRSIYTGAFYATYWPAVDQPGHTLPNGDRGGVTVYAQSAADINNNGLIVGTGEAIPAGELHGLYQPMAWTPQQYSIVLRAPDGVPAANFGGSAAAVNSLGQIAGQGVGLGSPNQGRALKWNSADAIPSVLEFATLFGSTDASNVVADMNDAGYVVGRTYNFNVGYQGVLWDELGKAYLLDDLITNAPGYQFLWADGINNHNWITGNATDPEGNERPVLLIPIPEPATCMCLVIGGSLLRLSRNKKPCVRYVIATSLAVADSQTVR